MTEKLKRVQMLLESRQHYALANIAHQQGKSVAEVTRHIIDLGLNIIEEQGEFASRAEALNRAEVLRRRIQERHGGPLKVDAAADLRGIREERDEHIASGGR
jgi:hypothetical protein